MTNAPARPQPQRSPVWLKLLICLLLSAQLCACVIGRKQSLQGNVDFRAFYTAGSILRMGHAPQLYNYDYQQQIQNTLVAPRKAPLPFLYPPFAATLFVPGSFLSYRQAFLLQLACNLALLFLTARQLRSTLPTLRSTGPLLLPASYACLFCVSIALMQGQISFLLLFACTMVYTLLGRALPFQAGLVFSLLTIKIQLALPILILCLAWKMWRLCLGFFAGVTFLALTSWLIVGTAGMRTYFNSILSVGSTVSSNAAAAKARFGMYPTDMPNLHGLTFGLSHGAAWGTALNLILCLAVLYWTWRRGPSWIAAVPAGMLVSYHMQPHDLVLLLLPLTIGVEAILTSRSLRLTPVSLSVAVAILLMLLPVQATLMAFGMGFVVVLAVVCALWNALLQPGTLDPAQT